MAIGADAACTLARLRAGAVLRPELALGCKDSPGVQAQTEYGLLCGRTNACGRRWARVRLGPQTWLVSARHVEVLEPAARVRAVPQLGRTPPTLRCLGVIAAPGAEEGFPAFRVSDGAVAAVERLTRASAGWACSRVAGYLLVRFPRSQALVAPAHLADTGERLPRSQAEGEPPFCSLLTWSGEVEATTRAHPAAPDAQVGLTVLEPGARVDVVARHPSPAGDWLEVARGGDRLLVHGSAVRLIGTVRAQAPVDATTGCPRRAIITRLAAPARGRGAGGQVVRVPAGVDLPVLAPGERVVTYLGDRVTLPVGAPLRRTSLTVETGTSPGPPQRRATLRAPLTSAVPLAAVSPAEPSLAPDGPGRVSLARVALLAPDPDELRQLVDGGAPLRTRLTRRFATLDRGRGSTAPPRSRLLRRQDRSRLLGPLRPAPGDAPGRRHPLYVLQRTSDTRPAELLARAEAYLDLGLAGLAQRELVGALERSGELPGALRAHAIARLRQLSEELGWPLEAPRLAARCSDSLAPEAAAAICYAGAAAQLPEGRARGLLRIDSDHADFARAQALLGVVRLAEGRTVEAEDHLVRALDAARGGSGPLLDRISALAAMLAGELNDPLAAAYALDRMGPQAHARFAETRLRLYAEAGRDRDALEAFDELCRGDATLWVTPHLVAAAIHRQRCELRAAKRRLEQAGRLLTLAERVAQRTEDAQAASSERYPELGAVVGALRALGVRVHTTEPFRSMYTAGGPCYGARALAQEIAVLARVREVWPRRDEAASALADAFDWRAGQCRREVEQAARGLRLQAAEGRTALAELEIDLSETRMAALTTEQTLAARLIAAAEHRGLGGLSRGCRPAGGCDPERRRHGVLDCLVLGVLRCLADPERGTDASAHPALALVRPRHLLGFTRRELAGAAMQRVLDQALDRDRSPRCIADEPAARRWLAVPSQSSSAQ